MRYLKKRIYVLMVQEHLDNSSRSPLDYMIRTSCKIVTNNWSLTKANQMLHQKKK